MLSEHNRLDIELYEFGKKLFEESLAKIEDVIRRHGLVYLPFPDQDRCRGFVMPPLASVDSCCRKRYLQYDKSQLLREDRRSDRTRAHGIH